MDSPLLAKLAALVQRRQQVERRQDKRLPAGERTVCLLRNGDDPPPAIGIHNLSLKGAGLLADREYPLGTVLPLLLVNGTHTFAVAVELKVVRTFRVVGGHWFVAGPFDRPLRHDELRPLMM
jgi:hypothetical protein